MYKPNQTNGSFQTLESLPQPTTNNLEGSVSQRLIYRNELYNSFIKRGLEVGFTDDQIDFLWEYFGNL